MLNAERYKESPMKPIRVFASFLAALCLFAGTTVAQKPKEPPPDYFPLRVGDWWTYHSTTADGKQSDFTMKVLSEDQGVYLVQIESAWPIQEWYSKPPGSVVWHKEAYPKSGQSVAFEPARQYLKNPPAGSWSWKGKGNLGVDIDETSTAAGAEPVTVPAGKFQAIKVVTKVVQGGTPVTKTYWYANWVGLVKSMTDTGSVQSTTELVDYSFKRK
jgi:hypothetical protein